MIINCRPSAQSNFTVFWDGYEFRGIRHKVKVVVAKEKSFTSFADADGFSRGMEKRGVKNISIIGD